MSERFGSDKSLHAWRGRVLVDHVLDSFRLVLGDFDLWLGVRAAHLRPALVEHFAGWEVTWVEDRSDLEGPLASVASALSFAAHQQPREWVFVCACDFPALSASMVSGLMELALASGTASAVVPRPNDQGWRAYQPLCALYRPGPALEHLESYVAGGGVRMMDFVATMPGLRAVEVDELSAFDPGWRRSLRNINAPEELDALDREDTAH